MRDEGKAPMTTKLSKGDERQTTDKAHKSRTSTTASKSIDIVTSIAQQQEGGHNEGAKEKVEAEVQGSEIPEGYYVVEAIKDRRKKNGRTEYYIKWSEWTDDHNTWEPAENVSIDCPTLVAEFEECRKAKKRKSAKSKDAYKFTPSQSQRKRRPIFSTRERGESSISALLKAAEVDRDALKNDIDEVVRILLDFSHRYNAKVREEDNQETGEGVESHVIEICSEAEEKGSTVPVCVEATKDCQDAEEVKDHVVPMSIATRKENEQRVMPNVENEDSIVVVKYVGGPSSNTRSQTSISKCDNIMRFQRQDEATKRDENAPSLNIDMDGTVRAKSNVFGPSQPIQNDLIVAESNPIIKIIKPSYSINTGSDQDLNVIFIVRRLNGNEDEVSNQYLKLNHSQLLIDFYERCIKDHHETLYMY